MTLRYSLEIDDFIQYQLYTGSKSRRVINQRRKNWVVFAFSVVILNLLINWNKETGYLVFSLGFGFLLIALYPFYLGYYYKRHYEKFVRDTHMNKVGILTRLDFDEDFIYSTDETGDSKIYYTNLETINETAAHFFLKLKTGESLVVPKRKLANPETFEVELRTIEKRFNVTRNSDLEWKWS
ncbi:YcxB family protein [Flavobacterium silvaticum]|uniref:YcxB family protein n=1 Tax=Flavobacterium silvaticum TaxID=1852020 RepID=A0A972JHG5_9FLAO|nr:YcxB family protein [Flavobacterium silvaticum]NMH27900.1 YcxB family protein [Flavobacterium silvaticum]